MTLFKRKKPMAETADATEKKDEWCPRMSGTMPAYRPQWKHRDPYHLVNKKGLKLEGGDDWTDVPFVIIRGSAAITLQDGTQVPLGVPFPRGFPGVYETIAMCGYEQALALGWSFAAWVAGGGGSVEVRAEEYELKYDIRARLRSAKQA